MMTKQSCNTSDVLIWVAPLSMGSGGRRRPLSRANRLPFATVSVISIPDPTTFDKSHAVSKWKQKEKCVIRK